MHDPDARRVVTFPTLSIRDAPTAVRTERLLLRAWREADREPHAVMNEDPAVMEHFPGTMTREQSDEMFDRVQAHWREFGWGLWAVDVPGEAPFIGFVGVARQVAPGRPVVEVGWRLARAHWGRGFATEAAERSLAFGFETLDLDEIVSFTVPQNARSRAVMERIGMHRDPEDDFDHPRIDAARYPQLVRHVLYRLTQPEWRARHVQEVG
jgi:RimJ/RimL family protein N-acetyltransferase